MPGICLGIAGGAKKDRVVVSVAVQDAEVVVVASVGVQVTGPESVLDPLLNCTVPVGPAPLLLVATFAVRVMLPPDTMLVMLGTTWVVVVALATVMV